MVRFLHQNDPSTKTGSGQTQGKHSKKTVFLTAQAAESPVAAIVTAAASSGGSYGGLGEYRPRGLRLRYGNAYLLRCHFKLKPIVISPRQARDKHRESSTQKRDTRFCRRAGDPRVVGSHATKPTRDAWLRLSLFLNAARFLPRQARCVYARALEQPAGFCCAFEQGAQRLQCC